MSAACGMRYLLASCGFPGAVAFLERLWGADVPQISFSVALTPSATDSPIFLISSSNIREVVMFSICTLVVDTVLKYGGGFT